MGIVAIQDLRDGRRGALATAKMAARQGGVIRKQASGCGGDFLGGVIPCYVRGDSRRLPDGWMNFCWRVIADNKKIGRF